MSQLDREDNNYLKESLEDTDLKFHQLDNDSGRFYDDGNSQDFLEDYSDKLKSESISQPKDFKHVTHTQYDKARGIKIKVIDPDLKEKFQPFVGGGGEAVLTTLIGRKDDKSPSGNIRGAKKSPKLSKEDIGSPTNYIHVSHCGADAMQKETLDVNNDVFESEEITNNVQSNSKEIIDITKTKGTDTIDCRPIQLAQQKIPFKPVSKQRKNLPPPPPLPPVVKSQDDTHPILMDSEDCDENTTNVEISDPHTVNIDSPGLDDISDSNMNDTKFFDNLSEHQMTTEL